MAANYGERLIPNLIDQRAMEEPDRVFASFAVDSDFRDLRDVDYGQLAQGIDSLAWWITKEIGTSDSFETICYLGRPSILNFLLIIATIKTGHQLLLLDLSQTAATSGALLEATKCRNVFVDDEPVISVAGFQSFGVHVTTLPPINHWLGDQGEKVEPYSYGKTFRQAQSDPLVVLTTSGSTKAPKPVIMRQGTVSHHDLVSTEALPHGPLTALGQLDGQRVLLGMPMNHSAGICFMTYAVYSTVIPVIGPPFVGYMPAKVAHAAHLQGNVSASFLTPWVLSEMAENPIMLASLDRLKFLTYGGFAMQSSKGDCLAKKTHLFTLFGSIETGFYPLEATDRDDWQWLHMSPAMGAVFKEVGVDAFQLFFERGSHLSKGIFHTFPDLPEEYDTKDLFARHPSKQDHYLHQGRSDLLLRFGSRDWVNPIPFEVDVEGHALVSGALLCGSGRVYPSLLIEAKVPPNSPAAEQELLDQIWPTINHANQRLHDFKVERGLVTLTDLSKPMARSTKGAVQRKATLDLYKQEREVAYERFMAHLADSQGISN